MPATGTEIQPTPRERMLASLRGQPVDRIPVWLMRQAGRYLPQYQAVRKNYDFLDLCKTPEAAAEVSVQPVEIIASDAVIIFNDILVPLELMGANVIFDDRGPLITNPVRTRDELLALTGPGVRDDEPITRTIETVRRRVGPDFPVLGFIGSPWTLAAYWIEGRMTRNFESLLKMRWSAPDLLDEILERITETATRYLEIQIEAGADAVQIFDTWGSALRAPDYERFSGRWIRTIIQRLSKHSAPKIVYVNGCAPYLDQMNSLGADCLSIDWRVPLSSVRERFGPGVALQGNLDPLVLYSNPEAVDAAVRQIFDDLPPAPGHVFNLGHGVLPATPVENVKALVKAVKTYGVCR